VQWLFWWRPPCLLRRVIVNLSDDPATALQGVLWRSRGPWLVIREAAMLRAGAEPQHLDGEALVHRDNVAFIQVVA
jgi:hypothetical protein